MGEKPTASKTEQGLNLQQEAFCQVYTGQDRELFGNGTMSYLETYGEEYLTKNDKPMTYQVAMVSASNLLRNPKIITRINGLLSTGGFSDENVDKQHLFLINQYADLKTKLGAIAEYNKLKARITKKIDLTTKGKSFNLEELSNDELTKLAEGSTEGDSSEDIS